jgi:cyanate permease
VILPFLFGWLQRASGSYSLCFAVAAGVCAAVAVLLLWTGRQPRAQA